MYIVKIKQENGNNIYIFSQKLSAKELLNINFKTFEELIDRMSRILAPIIKKIQGN